MSEENHDIQENKKGGGAYVAIIILLLLGLATMGYLWSSKNSQLNECQNENKRLHADMEGMNEMMSGYVGNLSNDMKTDFKNMLSTYDALLEKDRTQADSINAQKERIAELLEKVERGNMSAHQLFLARKEIETMKRIMRGYIVQIDSLNTLNLRLTNDLDSTSNALTMTQSERDKYREDAEEKGDLVKKGQKLQAFNFETTALKMKLNNMPAPTNRARSTGEIKSSFTISANPITTPGEKAVYMQIITPEGKTMQSSSSNVITTTAGAVAYSDMKKIDYQNERIDVAVYYKLRGEEATKGNYKVKIYCQGDLIGTDSFTLK